MFLGVMPTILRPSLLSAILKPQDVFATSLYTGTGAAQTITNGLDMAGKGGLFWGKNRTGSAANHALFDTLRAGGKGLSSDTTGAEVSAAGFGVTSFNNNGVTLGQSIFGENVNGAPEVGWSFARAAKFFDIVTWTGDGTSNRQIPHGLGVVPGMVIIKTRGSGNWAVGHRLLGAADWKSYLYLNTTQAQAGTSQTWPTAPSSSVMTIGSDPEVNGSGIQFVAYLFAHDASADGIVQCGSFTGASNTAQAVTLGFQPQFLMLKRTDSTSDWQIVDTSRGWGAGADARLFPNLSSAEASFDIGAPTSTGFTIDTTIFTGTFIYLAIRAAY